jgi:hypothetical protein
MNERILGILKLCLHAKEMGHNVWFEYAPHVAKIGIYAYSDRHNFEPDETPDMLFSYEFYMDSNEEGINLTLDNMETAIQKLINGEFE